MYKAEYDKVNPLFEKFVKLLETWTTELTKVEKKIVIDEIKHIKDN